MLIATVALLLAASPVPAPRALPAAAERDWGAPPPGASPEDRRLWRSLKESTAAATVHLMRINQLAWRLTYGRHYEGLDARKGDAAASAARTELAAAAQAAQTAVPVRPGVHACRTIHVDLDQRIELPRSFKDVEKVRGEARECAAKMTALEAAVRPAADRLELALARADALLGRAGQQPPPGSTRQPDDAGAALREGKP